MIIVFDTETTGLPKHGDAALDLQPEVFEFGGQRLDRHTGEVIDEFEALIKPKKPLNAEITKITGMTNERLKDAPPFIEVWPSIEAYFNGCVACFAHNLPFDELLINYELQRLGIEFKWPTTKICTIGLFSESFGANMKLTKLYESILGKPLIQEHRGLADVKALTEIIQHERLFELI